MRTVIIVISGKDNRINEYKVLSWVSKLALLDKDKRNIAVTISWDHLIAYKFARNRFKRGRNYLWEHIKWVSMIGNFSGIDSRANRVLQDKGPSYKFLKQSGNGPVQNYTNPNFIKTDPCLTRNDIKQCVRIEELLKNKLKEEAGAVLHDFVANRTLLIWKHICRVIGRPPKPLQSSEG